jgi:hypothetical protein
MRTQMLTQVLTTLALAGLLVGGTSDPQAISGERALLNRVGAAPITSTSQRGPIDPASALLGHSAEPSGFLATQSGHSDALPARIGGERALLGRSE